MVECPHKLFLLHCCTISCQESYWMAQQVVMNAFRILSLKSWSIRWAENQLSVMKNFYLLNSRIVKLIYNYKGLNEFLVITKKLRCNLWSRTLEKTWHTQTQMRAHNKKQLQKFFSFCPVQKYNKKRVKFVRNNQFYG